MTSSHLRIPAALASSLLLVTLSVSAQTPAPAPTVTVLQPAGPPPPAAPPVQPAPPPQVVVVQPSQPAQPPPPPRAAQPAPTVYVYELPPQPSYAYAAPPPPPPAPPKAKKRAGVHTHDGFYLRMGLGVAALVLADNSRRDADTSLSTGGAAFEFAMGGTIGDGFVLGGRLIAAGGESLELDSAGDRTKIDGSLSYGTVQLFADWYLDPESGLHLEGALGPASVTYDPSPSGRDDPENDSTNLEGFGGSVGVGLEGWVGEQWSLGGLLRVNWAALNGSLYPAGSDEMLATRGEDPGGTLVAIAPMLMLTGTFH